MNTLKKKSVQKGHVFSFSVIYEADEKGGYIAFAPTLPGCHTQGETLEETEQNIKEAITLYVESLLNGKNTIPREARILQGRVEVLV